MNVECEATRRWTFIGLCEAVQAEDGIRDYYASRGLGDVYKRQRMDKM